MHTQLPWATWTPIENFRLTTPIQSSSAKSILWSVRSRLLSYSIATAGPNGDDSYVDIEQVVARTTGDGQQESNEIERRLLIRS